MQFNNSKNDTTMLKFTDYFFLKTFLFLIRLKKEEGDAKWSAFLHTGVYASIFIIQLVCLIGLLYDNQLCRYFKDNSLFFWMTAFILSPILLSFRYYRYTDVSAIEASYNAFSKSKRNLIDIAIYAVMITIPVSTFILFRLYVIGHLRWW